MGLAGRSTDLRGFLHMVRPNEEHSAHSGGNPREGGNRVLASIMITLSNAVKSATQDKLSMYSVCLVLVACAVGTAGAALGSALLSVVPLIVLAGWCLWQPVRLLPREMMFQGRPAASVTGGQISALKNRVESLETLRVELESSKAVAEAAVAAKSEFLATMSHEILTPINGIIPLLELMRGSPMTDELKELLDTVQQSSQDLLRIVSDVLQLSKLEAGSVVLECRQFNLRDELEHIKRLMSQTAQAKSVSLSVRLDPGVGIMVQGDALRLRQVLTNLVSNAIKFTSAGTVVIAVAKRASTRMHQLLSFSVTDTGIGLAPDVAQRLFRPYAQAEVSTARNYGGTGLGLLISRRLVEAMNGEIGVTSKLGKGSTFWFNVKLLKSPDDVRRGSERMRALVLCREPVLQATIFSSLRTLGVQVSVSDTALEAMRVLQGAAGLSAGAGTDVILIDYRSFHATIISLIRKIRGDELLRDMRIVVLGRSEEVPDEVSLWPCVAVVSPEFNERQLTDFVASVLYGDSCETEAVVSSEYPVSTVVCPGPTGGLQGVRVLLVEDVAISRKVGQLAMTKLGVHVEVANDGREALRCLEEGVFDAVLMDCQLPDIDGFAATRVQREREQLRGGHVPIIALTANAIEGHRERCLEMGMDDYLVKPLDKSLLAEVLTKWVARGRLGERPESAKDSPSDRLNIGALRTLYLGSEDSLERLAERWQRDVVGLVAAIQSALAKSDKDAALRSLRALKTAAKAVDAHLLRSGMQSIELAIVSEGKPLTEELARLKTSCEITASQLWGQICAAGVAA